MDSEQIVLGTAQLGLEYGIANKFGKPNQSEAKEIVAEAWESGMREFDTAQGYGNSESVLGLCLSDLNISNKALIITKLAPDLNFKQESFIKDAIGKSLAHLGIQNLHGLMLHREELLSEWTTVYKYLKNQVIEGTVKRLGISVYSPQKALQAIKSKGIDFVQFPSNIFDRRFENAGIYNIAQDLGKDIYIRSVFLQGLVFLKPQDLPPALTKAAPLLEELQLFVSDYKLKIEEITMGYIKNEMPKAKVVLGVENKEQIRKNISYWQKNVPIALSQRIKEKFKDVDEKILNPSLWNKKV